MLEDRECLFCFFIAKLLKDGVKEFWVYLKDTDGPRNFLNSPACWSKREENLDGHLRPLTERFWLFWISPSLHSFQTYACGIIVWLFNGEDFHEGNEHSRSWQTFSSCALISREYGSQAGRREGRQAAGAIRWLWDTWSPQVNITLELAGIKAPLIILFSVVFLWQSTSNLAGKQRDRLDRMFSAKEEEQRRR